MSNKVIFTETSFVPEEHLNPYKKKQFDKIELYKKIDPAKLKEEYESKDNFMSKDT